MNSVPQPGYGLVGVGVVLFSVAGAADEHDWQANRLMQPTKAQLRAEACSAVAIYDGLEIGQVNAALDHHLERIQNMMFVRIHHLPRTGAGDEAEDDGCD